MFNLESDEMTGLWPNDSLTFTFYMTRISGPYGPYEILAPAGGIKCSLRSHDNRTNVEGTNIIWKNYTGKIRCIEVYGLYEWPSWHVWEMFIQ